ncbi:acetyltransferase [Simonsiella muelleri]|uniref:Sialic acid O-acetyltransferase NeuD family sugar O-acyltransferase n=1 Tax=Simonsiella muelleri ATCC 29453 TaxID=641147 RepID=V9H9G5_9NEIS|nr:acetyltransferase [Simonsiella muelleri]AUX60702.1 shikimate dehydrogenase [Simonsiella muelleri ATCC 29453]EFG31740.1 sialic acid O-acetyltransferase NeuD family sugar O-acyltransferase [Simonsiella muelleri ATCC 29453]UBQ54477.1 acetyltransferase [Simonsiella muelleri]
MRKKVIFIGAGGYAKSALDSLDSDVYQLCGFIDNIKPIHSLHLGYPIVADSIENFLPYQDYEYFISIGNNIHRYDKFRKLQDLNCKIISIIDKTALVSIHAEIGIGTFIGKMAIVNSGAKIGNNVIINTRALIEHGCQIQNHCNISTNTTLNGDVLVKDFCFIGSSSVVNGQLHIGQHSVIGAGAVVIKNVEPHTIVAGVPAKFIKENK